MSSSSFDSINPVKPHSHYPDIKQGKGVKDSAPSKSLGERSSGIEKNIEELARAEGTTGSNVSKALREGGQKLARGLAGFVGLPLYSASIAVGGALAFTAFLGGAIFFTSPVLVGGALGVGMRSLMGKKTENERKGLEKIAELTVGAPTMLLSLPQILVINTAGKLGAGLTAFAFTGDKNSQLNLELKDHLKFSAFSIWEKLRSKED